MRQGVAYYTNLFKGNKFAALADDVTPLELDDALYYDVVGMHASLKARNMPIHETFRFDTPPCLGCQHSKRQAFLQKVDPFQTFEERNLEWLRILGTCTCNLSKGYAFDRSAGCLEPVALWRAAASWLPTVQAENGLYYDSYFARDARMCATNHSPESERTYAAHMNYVDMMYPGFFKHVERVAGSVAKVYVAGTPKYEPKKRIVRTRRACPHTGGKSLYILVRNEYVSSRRHRRNLMSTPVVDEEGEMPPRHAAPVRKLPRVNLAGAELIQGYDANALARTVADRARGKTLFPLPPEVYREADTRIPLFMDNSQQDYEAWWKQEFGEQLAVVNERKAFNFVMAKRHALDMFAVTHKTQEEREEAVFSYVDTWFNEASTDKQQALLRMGFTRTAARAPHVVRSIFDLLTRFRLDPDVFEKGADGVVRLFRYVESLVLAVRKALLDGLRRATILPSVLATRKVAVKKAIMQTREVQETLAKLDDKRVSAHALPTRVAQAAAVKEVEAEKKTFFQNVVGPKVADRTRHEVFKQVRMARSQAAKVKVEHAKRVKQRDKFARHEYETGEMPSFIDDPAAMMDGEMFEFLQDWLPTAATIAGTAATCYFVNKFVDWIKRRVADTVSNFAVRLTATLDAAKRTMYKVLAIVGLLAIWYCFGRVAALAAVSAMSLAQMYMGAEEVCFPDVVSGFMNSQLFVLLGSVVYASTMEYEGLFRETAACVEEIHRRRTHNGPVLIQAGTQPALDYFNDRYTNVISGAALNGVRLERKDWPLLCRLHCNVNVLMARGRLDAYGAWSMDHTAAGTTQFMESNDEYDQLSMACVRMQLNLETLRDTVQADNTYTEESMRGYEVIARRLLHTQGRLRAVVSQRLLNSNTVRQPVYGTLASALAPFPPVLNQRETIVPPEQFIEVELPAYVPGDDDAYAARQLQAELDAATAPPDPLLPPYPEHEAGDEVFEEARGEGPDVTTYAMLIQGFVDMLAGAFGASSENAAQAMRIARMFALGYITKNACMAVVEAFKCVYGAFVYVITGHHPFEEGLVVDTEVAEDIMHEMTLVRTPRTDEDARNIMLLYDEALTFMVAAMKTRISSGYAKAFSVLTTHYETAKQRLSNPAARAPPVTVLFLGGAGSGKSTTMELLMGIICQRTYGRPIEGRDRYNQASDRFFQGYYNPLFYVYDEFRSTVDTVDEVAQANKMFLLINSPSAANLPMAEAADKGTKYFTSAYCLYGSNMTQETAETMGFKSAPAFARRITFAVEPLDTSARDPNHWTYSVVGGAYASAANMQKLGFDPEPVGRHSLAAILCNADVRTTVTLPQLAALMMKARVKSEYVVQSMHARQEQVDAVAAAFAEMEAVDVTELEYTTKPTIEPRVTPQHARRAHQSARHGVTEETGEVRGDCERSLAVIRTRRARPSSVRERLLKMMGPLAKMLIVAAPLLAGALWFMSSRAHEDGEAVGSRGLPKSVSVRKRTQRKPKKAETPTVYLTENGENASNAHYPEMDARIKAVAKTQCFVAITGVDGQSVEVRGTYVTPNHVMVVGHSVPPEVKCVRVCEMGGDPRESVAFVPDEIVMPSGHDLAIFRVSQVVNGIRRDCPPHACIRSFTLPHDAVMQSSIKGARLQHVCYDAVSNGRTVRPIVGEEIRDAEYHTASFGTRTFNNMLKYKMVTESGFCGALVFMEINGCAHVVGFHVAGNKRNSGTAHLITTEFIESISDMAGEAAPTVPTPQAGVREVTFTDIEDTHFGLRVVGVVDENFRVKPGGKTKYSASPLYGMFASPAYAPAVLEDPAYPLAMTKFPTKVAGKGVVPHADRVMALFKHFYPPDDERKLYSLKQAVVGDSGVGLKGLDMATSTGLPWSAGGDSDKTRYVRIERDGEKVLSVGLDKEVHTAVTRRIELAKKGERSLTVFCQRLKDELRGLDKVAACKTRLFDNGPLDYLIALRVYMLDMTQYCKVHCEDKPISLGVNAHGPDWMALYGRLVSHNEYGADGDFANFDASIMPEIGMLAIKIINDWYGGVGAKARTTLLWELLNTYHVAGNKLFMTYGSHPSGDPITTLWNSICNFIILTSCFFQISEETGVKYDPYKLQMALYGDDNIIVVAEDGFPYDRMTELVYEWYGMTLTASDKSGPMKKGLVRDMTYLSRAFVFRQGVCHAPLEMEVLYSILDWQKSKDLRDFQSRINSFFYELTHHPPAHYEKHYIEVLRHPWVQECGFEVPTLAQSLHRRLHW